MSQIYLKLRDLARDVLIIQSQICLKIPLLALDV